MVESFSGEQSTFKHYSHTVDSLNQAVHHSAPIYTNFCICARVIGPFICLSLEAPRTAKQFVNLLHHPLLIIQLHTTRHQASCLCEVNNMIISWHRYPDVLLQFHDTSSSSHVIVLLRYFSIVLFTVLQAWGGMVNVIFQSFTLFMSPL